MGLSRHLFPLQVEAGLRIELSAGESFRALLYRIADEHGLRTVKPVLDACRQPGPRPLSRASLPTVAKLCGASVADLEQLGGRDADYNAGESTWKFGCEVVSHYPSVDTRLLPVCPHCLREGRPVPALVHIAPMTACWLHACRLVFKCSCCAARLQSNRRRLMQCDCGFDLRDAIPEPAASAELKFSQALSIRCGTGKASPVIVSSDFGLLNIGALSLNELVYVHWAVGHALQNPQTSCLGSRRRLTPDERIAANSQALLTLATHDHFSAACVAWSDVYPSQSARTAWFIQSVLRQLLAMRGMNCFVSCIPAKLLKRAPAQRRRRPSATVPVRMSQLDLPFGVSSQ